MNCIEFDERGNSSYGLITKRDDESLEVILFTEVPYISKEAENEYLKGMSEMVLLDKVKTVLKSSVIRYVYVLLESIFIRGEIIFRYGMNDIFWTKSKDDEAHNSHFTIPFLRKSLAWKNDRDCNSTEFYSFLLFRLRLVKSVQTHLSSKKGRGRQATVPQISCTLQDFYALLESAESSVLRDFKQSLIVVNNVHTINGGVQKLLETNTILQAFISCPTLLDCLLGYR
jgi:hypothetical protein